MFIRRELKEKAKVAFKRNYWVCVITALILGWLVDSSVVEIKTQTQYEMGYYTTGQTISFLNIPLTNASITVVLSAIVAGLLISIFISNVLQVGGCRVFVQNADEPADFRELLYGFNKQFYKNIVYVQFIKELKVFLWSLALIIPGIIKAYEYFMVPYILAENPEMSEKEALALSKEMMDGYKWKTFVLQISFILWVILNVFTFGIAGIFYVNPYIHATNAELFQWLKNKDYMVIEHQG